MIDTILKESLVTELNAFYNIPDKDIFGYMNMRYKYAMTDYNTNNELGDNDDILKYKVTRPDETVIRKTGTCFEYSELLSMYYMQHGRSSRTPVRYYITGDTNDGNQPCHVFTIIYPLNEPEWVEWAWGDNEGRHKYSDIDKCLSDIMVKWIRSTPSCDNVRIHRLDKNPPYHVSCFEYMEFCETQPVVLSNNTGSVNESYNILDTPLFAEADEDGDKTLDEIVDEKQTKDDSGKDTEDESSMDNAPEGMSDVDDLLNEPLFADDGNKPDDTDEIDDENVENNGTDDTNDIDIDEPPPESPPEDIPEEPKQPARSMPKQTDAGEVDRNGVRRKKLYIAFIEWCKGFNSKNSFGSVFDKDAFNTTFPFVHEDLRYFYRLANPMLCVLSGNLTFFALSELKSINKPFKEFPQIIIFAATDKDYRVFNCDDRKVYRADDKDGAIELGDELAETFDLYIQTMIDKGDILAGPIDESVEVSMVI